MIESEEVGIWYLAFPALSVRVKEILSNCTPDKFMVYYPLLLEYFKPKLARVDKLDLDKDTPPLTKIEIVDSTKQ